MSQPIDDSFLDGLIQSISAFLDSNDSGDASFSLPQAIQNLVDSNASTRSELHATQQRIQILLSQISKLHASLDAALPQSLTKHTTSSVRSQTAAHALLATTIENLLLKLSLTRSQAHKSLYSFSPSEDNSGPNMTDALRNAHDFLVSESSALQREEEALDRQIAEYDTVLALVDSKYPQVVKDYVRVQQETEECRRDLRRLGWSGE